MRLIDTDELINCVNERILGKSEFAQEIRADFLSLIDEQPTIERPRGEWLRMSNLLEHVDNRYKCSKCGNVVYYKDKIDLYTFNSWCGRCGSFNGRKLFVEKDKAENEVKENE